MDYYVTIRTLTRLSAHFGLSAPEMETALRCSLDQWVAENHTLNQLWFNLVAARDLKLKQRR